MKVKTLLYDTADILVIMFATSSIILIIAKLYNFSFVKDIDSTTLVAIPASIFAYFTYKISKKQTHQMIIRQYTEHMEDFFDTWTKYQNSFPFPKYLGIMKNNNEKIEDIIPNYLELKGKLMILKLRADKFGATEISMAMQTFWNKFLKSQEALSTYYIYDQEGYRNERNKASKLLSDNVIYFLNDGLLEMNNAYNEAIRKLQ
ncbi:MAG: hypothetical protein K2X04_02830 [Burkholderiales bacterium]|nr:hypothetical protein [Burkholderiales bacterium]